MYDIFLAHKILNNGKPVSSSLAAMSKELLDVDLNSSQLQLFEEYPSKSIVSSYRDIGSDNFSLDQIKYAASDVKLPMIIYKKLLPEIRRMKLSQCVSLENQFVTVLANIEYKGFFLDKEKWVELAYSNKNLLMRKIFQMNNYLLDNNLEDYIGIK